MPKASISNRGNRTFRLLSYMVLVLHSVCFSHYIRSSSAVRIPVVALCSVALTSIVVLYLSHRVISLESAFLIRLSSPQSTYQRVASRAVILSNSGLKTITNLILATSTLSILPGIWTNLARSAEKGVAARLIGPAGWIFGTIAFTVAAASLVFSTTQESIGYTFIEPIIEIQDRHQEKDQGKNKTGFEPLTIPDDQVPISLLRSKLHPSDQTPPPWYKVGYTTRRHDIYIRIPAEESKTGTFQLKAKLGADHPLYEARKKSGQDSTPVVAGKL